MSAPVAAWLIITSTSSGSSRPGFCRMASGMPIFPMSCISPASSIASTSAAGSPSSCAVARAKAATRSEWLRVYGSLASTVAARLLTPAT